jgi:hypothetical protein
MAEDHMPLTHQATRVSLSLAGTAIAEREKLAAMEFSAIVTEIVK